MKQIKKLNIAMVCTLMLAGGNMSGMEEVVAPEKTSWFQKARNELQNSKISEFIDKNKKALQDSIEKNKDALKKNLFGGPKSVRNSNIEPMVNADADWSNLDPNNHFARVNAFAKVTDDSWNFKDKNGNELLHAVAMSPMGNSNDIEAFLQKGADINSRNKDGQTPLMIAAKRGAVYPLQEFIKNGADINLKDKNGKTALHYAAELGHFNIVNELLDNSTVLMNEKDSNGNTPLHLAYDLGPNAPIDNSHGYLDGYINNHVNIVEKLIGSKAKQDVENKDGKIPGQEKNAIRLKVKPS